VGNRKARSITDRERNAIWSCLETHCTAGDFGALRMRAIATLVIDTTLRLSEVLHITLRQLLEDTSAKSDLRILSSFYLHRVQAKGRATVKKTKAKRGEKKKKPRAGYSSERTVNVPRRAREALRAYLRELRARKWVTGAWSGTPWITIKGRGEARHAIPSKRTIQAAWTSWQKRAGIEDPYRFHDLRHTAITRLSGAGDNVFAVAEIAGHHDVRTTQKYVHTSPAKLSALAQRASDL
jgi:integrase